MGTGTPNALGHVAAVTISSLLAFAVPGLTAEPTQGVHLFVGRFTTETTGDSADQRDRIGSFCKLGVDQNRRNRIVFFLRIS